MHLIYPAVVHSAVPNLVRQPHSLDGEWGFRIDPDETGAREAWQTATSGFNTPIQVPGSVWALTELSEDYPSHKQPNRYAGVCWYQREFELDSSWMSDRIWLKFGGISPTANIWLNGHYVCHHRHPIVGFKCDITDFVRFDSPNRLTIELTRWSDLERRHSVVGGWYHGGPGIYLGVELERTGDLRIEDVYIRPRIDDGEVRVSATVYNDGAVPLTVEPLVSVGPRPEGPFESAIRGDTITVEQGENATVDCRVDLANHRRWSLDDPFLYCAMVEARIDGVVADRVTERFGMRSFAVEHGKLVLNHEPIMWRTGSPEFDNCPTISPLVDPGIIRRRIQAMKDTGFNGNRLHTHAYSREAFDICDEMGFLLQVEPSVISNFHELRPYPESREALVAKVKEARNHPSVVVLCLGNENSQIMDHDGGVYQERARVHLDDVRNLIPDHLILTGAGYQGEYPEVHNDFQTPHFWSDNFRWAYDGLASAPWSVLRRLSDDGPLVLHEYGKLTVWPDPEEDRLFADSTTPLSGKNGEMGRTALREAGIESLLPLIVENSRRLSAACTKILIERPRREPGIQGYQYHCVLRVGHNRGFIDDFGHRVDPQFCDLISANSDTAIVIDRDFRRRTTTSGEPVELRVFLSHYASNPIENARLTWRVEASGEATASGTIEGISFPQGENGMIGEIRFDTPHGLGMYSVTLALISDGVEVSANRWHFWRFPFAGRTCQDSTAMMLSDDLLEHDLFSHYGTIRRVADLVSGHLGIKTHAYIEGGKDRGEFVSRVDPQIVFEAGVKTAIADRWTEHLRRFVELGGSALLIDRGMLPIDWYARSEDRDGAYDTFRLYTPFRSGWDHGNAATIIVDHPILEDFPHEGWCNLQFFDLIQGAATLRTHGLPGTASPIIRVIPIWRLTGVQTGPAPAPTDIEQRWATEDRCYMAESQIGTGRLLVTSLRLTSSNAGWYLLERTVKYLEGSEPREATGGRNGDQGTE